MTPPRTPTVASLLTLFLNVANTKEAIAFSFADVSTMKTTAFISPSFPLSNKYSGRQKIHLISSYCPLRLNLASGGDDVAAVNDKTSAQTTRPSLHPITIEALSDILKIRSTPSQSSSTPVDIGVCDSNNDRENSNKENAVQPLDIAMSAGKIAAEALDRQSDRFKADDKKDLIFTPEENQVVAGRVVGVVMRMRSLESDLIQRVKNNVDENDDVDKETFERFGVLQKECCDGGNDEEIEEELSCRIRDDTSFGMCRAESLLAIFLKTVEEPTMNQMDQSLPGGSDVNFMDDDRTALLFGHG